MFLGKAEGSWEEERKEPVDLMSLGFWRLTGL